LYSGHGIDAAEGRQVVAVDLWAGMDVEGTILDRSARQAYVGETGGD